MAAPFNEFSSLGEKNASYVIFAVSARYVVEPATLGKQVFLATQPSDCNGLDLDLTRWRGLEEQLTMLHGVPGMKVVGAGVVVIAVDGGHQEQHTASDHGSKNVLHESASKTESDDIHVSRIIVIFYYY